MTNKKEWFDETVEQVPYNKGLYKLICFFTFKRKKKLTYKELYLFLLGLNRDRKIFKNQQEVLKITAMSRIFEIYKFNNGAFPKDITTNDIG